MTSLVALLCFGLISLQAQFAGSSAPDHFRDTSMLKPALGSKVSVIVFEDLGCPACAHAHPIEAQAAEKYHVPLVRYDFPFPQHLWTFEGAVCARHLQNRVKSQACRGVPRRGVRGPGIDREQGRSGGLYAALDAAARPGDAVCAGPGRRAGKKVRADYDLGLRLNVQYTPTVVVVTRDHYQVVYGTKDGPSDPQRLFPVIEAALAQAKASTVPVHR